MLDRDQLEATCLRNALAALSRSKDSQLRTFFDCCLRWHQQLSDPHQNGSLERRKHVLENMLTTAQLLLTGNLDTVTYGNKSKAPVDKKLFPDSTDSGNAVS